VSRSRVEDVWALKMDLTAVRAAYVVHWRSWGACCPSAASRCQRAVQPRAVAAGAVCGLTTLTTLRFYVERDEDGEPMEEAGEWMLDLGRLTTLQTMTLTSESIHSTGQSVDMLGTSSWYQ
jgi:hypothetical protein